MAADSAGQPAANGGDGQAPVTAADIAAQVGGRLIGDGTVSLRGVAPLDSARAQDLSFLTHARYAAWFANSRAGAVIMAPQFEHAPGTSATRIIVDKPMDAMVSVLARFHRPEPRVVGVHAAAVVSASASIGAGVTIDPCAVIGDHVVIGDGCWIGANAVVGAGSVLGRDVRLHAQATVYPYTELGDRVVLCSGARVGREGFGFVPQANGPVRIPHSGRCILEHDVEIGANSCVDRGSIDDTIIGAGTKIDNLVQIGHNVRIGRMCFFAAQAGVAGSARIEDGVQVGGQAGIGGHLTIGARATVAGQAAAFGDVPAGEVWSGYPARPHKDQLRSLAALARLSHIIRPLERLLKGESAP